MRVFDGEPGGGGQVLHSLEFESDERGRLGAVEVDVPAQPVRRAVYTYSDASGLLERVRFSEGGALQLELVQVWQHDPRSRLERVEWRDAVGVLLASFEYVLDPAGHRLAVLQGGELGLRELWYNGQPGTTALMPDKTYRLTHEDHFEGAPYTEPLRSLRHVRCVTFMTPWATGRG